MNTRAQNLENHVIIGDWKILNKVSQSVDDTGGHFSIQYIAEKDGFRFFFKAFDIERTIRGAGLNFTTALEHQMKVFNFEKELLEKCRERSLSKIVRVIEAGSIPSDDANPFPIPFLIFELADGNVREYLKFQTEVDFAWKLKSLHDIATGIQQLHSVDIIHQDIKPSNILQFKEDSKIADLGRSKTFSGTGPYDKILFSGDKTYAPIETYSEFSFLQPEKWLDKNLAMDSYALGNLMTFYFSGLNMSALIISRFKKMGLASSSTREELLTYLNTFYQESLNEIRKGIEYDAFKDDITTMIEQLCNPDPNLRGDPITIRSIGGKYALHRYITKLDLLQKKAEIMVKKDGAVLR